MVINISTESDLEVIRQRISALEARVAALEPKTENHLLINGIGPYVDYSFSVSGALYLDTEVGEASDIVAGVTATGAVSNGPDGYYFTGDLLELKLSSAQVEVKLNGIPLDPAQYVTTSTPDPEPEPDPDPEPEPDPIPDPTNSELKIEVFKHLVNDPETYTLGWASAFPVIDPETDRTLFMPVMGNSHDNQGNNSIRGYDAVTKQWITFQSDVGYTTTVAANRDNYIGWYVPWRDELWIVGGAGQANHGIFEFELKKWIYLWANRNDFGTGIIDTTGIAQPWDAHNPATVTCAERKELIYFGGEILGNPQNRLAIIDTVNGTFVEHTGPLKVMRCRNNAAIDGTTMYFVGGTIKNSAGQNVLSNALFSLDLNTLQWKQLADAPEMTDYPLVTWDAKNKFLVLFSGEGKKLLLVYNPITDVWSDFTEQLPATVGIKNGCCAYIDGAHYYRGGNLYVNGISQDWTTSRHVYVLQFNTVANAGESNDVIESDGITIDTVNWDKAKPPMKHTKAVELKGRVYINGGDFSGPGHVQSYRQDMYSFNLIDKSWQEEHPYCAIAPNVQPLGPDICGFVNHNRPNRLLLLPGLQEKSNDNNCPGIGGKVMEFDTLEKKWSIVETKNSMFSVVGSTVTDNLPMQAVYDPVMDSVYQVGYLGEVIKYDVTNAEYSKLSNNPFGVGVNPNKQGLALVDRDVVLLDAKAQRLLAYSIDRGVGRIINRPPFTIRHENCYPLWIPWLKLLFIHNFTVGNAQESTSWFYNFVDDTYQKLTLLDNANRVARARCLCLDYTNEQIVMLGHSDAVEPIHLVRIA